MTEIAPDSAGFDKLRQFRNFLAHSTLKEIDDELEFEDRFREIEDAVDALFEPLPERRRHWRSILRQIRKDDIVAIQSKIGGFNELIAAARVEGDVVYVDADSVVVNNNVYNININVGGLDDLSSLGWAYM